MAVMKERNNNLQSLVFDNNALRCRRKELRYTQQEVADSINVSCRTYQKWEAGVTVPDATSFLRLMAVLGSFDTQSFMTYISEEE